MDKLIKEVLTQRKAKRSSWVATSALSGSAQLIQAAWLRPSDVVCDSSRCEFIGQNPCLKPKRARTKIKSRRCIFVKGYLSIRRSNKSGLFSQFVICRTSIYDVKRAAASASTFFLANSYWLLQKIWTLRSKIYHFDWFFFLKFY